jgi:hypothetical protein
MSRTTRNQADELYQKWNEWIDILDSEILNLYTQRDVFQEVQKIIRDNARIQSPSAFHHWMRVWYSSSMAMTVRRQADNRKDVVSYRRLLVGIKANPIILSRDRFRRNFVGGGYEEADADQAFNQILGKRLKHIDPLDVDKEIRTLEAKSAKVTYYATKRVAHHR